MYMASYRQKIRKTFIVTVKHIFISARHKIGNDLGAGLEWNMRKESIRHAKGVIGGGERGRSRSSVPWACCFLEAT